MLVSQLSAISHTSTYIRSSQCWTNAWHFYASGTSINECVCVLSLDWVGACMCVLCLDWVGVCIKWVSHGGNGIMMKTQVLFSISLMFSSEIQHHPHPQVCQGHITTMCVCVCVWAQQLTCFWRSIPHKLHCLNTWRNSHSVSERSDFASTYLDCFFIFCLFLIWTVCPYAFTRQKWLISNIKRKSVLLQ